MDTNEAFVLLQEVGQEDLVRALCNYCDSTKLEEFIEYLRDEELLPEAAPEEDQVEDDEDDEEDTDNE